MNTLNCPTSACRVCRYYQPEGRRGGACQQLGVPVKASWKACSLALPPFAPSWESVEIIWQDEKLAIAETLSVSPALGDSHLEPIELETPATSKRVAADIVLV